MTTKKPTLRKSHPPLLTEAGFMAELIKAVDAAGSQRALARKLRFSAAYVGDVIAERRKVSWEFAWRLGFEQQTTYQRVYSRLEQEP